MVNDPISKQKKMRTTSKLALSLKESQRIVLEAEPTHDPQAPTNPGVLLQTIAGYGRDLNERLQLLLELAHEEHGPNSAMVNHMAHCLELCRAVQMNAMEGSHHHLSGEKEPWDMVETTQKLLEQLRTILPAGALEWDLPDSEFRTRIPRQLWLVTLQKSILQCAELQTAAGLEVLLVLRTRKGAGKSANLVLEIHDKGREVTQSEMERRLTDGAGSHAEWADSFHLLLLLAIAVEGDLEIVSDPASGTCRRLIMPLGQFRSVPRSDGVHRPTRR